MTAFLITSAAYCDSEFTAEFGLLPPAFLPIGNKRLFEIQHSKISQAMPEQIILSLPEGFSVDKFDSARMEQLGFKVIHVPQNISLAESIIYVINVSNLEDSQINIIHGDTLIDNVDFSVSDVLSVGYTDEYYDWAEWHEPNGLTEVTVENPAGTRQVITGYFSFSSSRLLLQALTKSRGKFIRGLEIYNESRPLKKLTTGSWMDFGHIQTYYQSRAKITTQRAFNTLNISPRVVQKCSAQKNKIFAEGAWFAAMPDTLKPFMPQLISHAAISNADNEEQACYAIEYLPLLPLTDLLVYGRLPYEVWRAIFRACDEFLTACAHIKPENPGSYTESANSLYLKKTLERLEVFSSERGISLHKNWTLNGVTTPSLYSIANHVGTHLRSTAVQDISIIHGDFCFSNILYDFRTQAVKVIDPRGIDGDGQQTIFGDQRYDIAKLYHSVVGNYDHIIAGRYEFSDFGNNHLALALPSSSHAEDATKAFLESTFNGKNHNQADSLAICIMLFLSMLPLHYDRPERQMALMANALRLYQSFTG